MTVLLEIREKIKLIYSKNEMFIIPVVKFLLAFLVMTVINGRMGYMNALDNPAVVLVIALLCSFLPIGFMILFGALISLLHMYALSMEVALVGLCLYVLMYLLFFRFSPKDSLVVILTPLLFAMNIPYIMPIAMGLIGTPASAVSVGCGVIVYYFLSLVMSSATAISSMESGEAIAKVRILIDGLLDKEAMAVVLVAFSVTILVVWLIRRLSVDFAWTIAIVTGGITNVVLLLLGDLKYGTNISAGSVILGTLLALVIAKVLEFFRFCVDYSRTEKVQFEDDEYYYYVKAVPKMVISAQTRTVKKINTQRHSAAMDEERMGQTRAARSAVTTERTVSGRRPAPGTQQGRAPQTRVPQGQMPQRRVNSRPAQNINNNEDIEEWE